MKRYIIIRKYIVLAETEDEAKEKLATVATPNDFIDSEEIYQMTDRS